MSVDKSSRAVLIGVADYNSDKTHGLSKIPQAANNIRRLAELLADPELCAFAVEDILQVLDPTSADDALTAVEQHGDNELDFFLVYYAGHGLLRQSGDRSSLWLTVPESLSDPTRGGDHIEYASLSQSMRLVQAKAKAIILDCCYAGAAHRDTMGTVEDTGLAGELLAEMRKVTPEGDWVLAAAGLEPSLAYEKEGDSYTVMSGELIKLLEKGLPGPDSHLTLNMIATTVKRRMAKRRDGGMYRMSSPDDRSRGTAGEYRLVANRAYDAKQAAEAPGRVLEMVLTDTAAQPLRAYALSITPGLERSRAIRVTEADRMELGLLWGVDRGRFAGVLADRLDRTVDLARDLRAVEDRLSSAAERCGVEMASRHWTRLRPMKVDTATAPMRVLEDLTEPSVPAELRGLIIPIEVGPRSGLIQPPQWRERLRLWLPELTRRVPGCALIVQVQAEAAVDAIWTALQLAPFVAKYAALTEDIPFDVATRFLPGDSRERLSDTELASSRPAVHILIDDLCQAERNRDLPTTLQPMAESGRSHPEWNAQLARVVVAELRDGPGARLAYGEPCPEARLLELVRAYAPPLWRPLLDAWAREEVDQRPILPLAAQLDRDLDVWLTARWHGPGLVAADLPDRAPGLSEALVLALHRLGISPGHLPGWLISRCERPLQKVLLDPAAYETEDAAAFLARSGRTTTFSPRTRAFWRMTALSEPTPEILETLLGLPDPYRWVVRPSPTEPDLEPQLLAGIRELRSRLRPGSTERRRVS